MSESEGSVRVVGTAHVSAESVREVEETIEAERPDAVAVELDEGRYRQMRGEEPEDLTAGDLLEGNTVFQFLAYWMLSYVQARMGDRFDIQPGAEMLAAVETAEELDIDLELVDRDIQETVRRFWDRMTFFEKLQVVGSLAFGVTDPRIGGVVFGLLVGVVLGPILGIFGGAIGVTQSLLVSLTGGAILAVGVGYVLSELTLRNVADDVIALGVAAAGGIAAGLVGAGLGLTDPLVTQYLGDFLITAVGSMTLGISAGLVVGVVVAGAMSLFGADESETEGEMEELLDPQELTDTDVVTAMMEEFREFSPGGAEALIDERDAFIAHHLVDLRAQGKDVVAIVGAGHQQGIERYLANPETLPPRDSLVGEDESLLPWGKLVAVAITVAFVAFFVLLAMAGVENRFLLELFAAWFLVNGVFAAGLARLAGARWPSALVGGSVAWLTSINPLLAPGWFAGYVELRYTTVNVGDIETLNELLDDQETPIGDLLRQMFEVPLFKLIMIVGLTNVGSFVASFLFALYVLPAFFGDIGGVEVVPQLLVEGAQNSARTIWGWVA